MKNKHQIILLLLFFIMVSARVSIAQLPFNIHGFIDGGYGVRTCDDPYEDSASLSEIRMQLDFSQLTDFGDFRIKSDFLCRR